MDLTIRRFEPADLPRLEEIREAAFRPIFASFRAIVGPEIAGIALTGEEAEQAGLLAKVCAGEGGAEVLVVVSDGVIAGFVSFTTDAEKQTGEIGLNAVHPGHAGKGIGTKLFEYVLGRMRERGVAVATVSTGGDPSHAAARRAYEKAGFGAAIPAVHFYRLLNG
jgi:ribosomal protein S18 acetylase RimI-like enzyme